MRMHNLTARASVELALSGKMTIADLGFTPEQHGKRIGQMLEPIATPASLQALRDSLRDDYGYPHTLREVVEIVASPDGRGWEPNKTALLFAYGETRHICRQDQDVVRDVVVRELLLDRTPITPGHAWWSSLSEVEREMIVERAVTLNNYARMMEASVRLHVDMERRSISFCGLGAPFAQDAQRPLLMEYTDGSPSDGVGMDNDDAALMSICAALEVM